MEYKLTYNCSYNYDVDGKLHVYKEEVEVSPTGKWKIVRKNESAVLWLEVMTFSERRTPVYEEFREKPSILNCWSQPLIKRVIGYEIEEIPNIFWVEEDNLDFYQLFINECGGDCGN